MNSYIMSHVWVTDDHPEYRFTPYVAPGLTKTMIVMSYFVTDQTVCMYPLNCAFIVRIVLE